MISEYANFFFFAFSALFVIIDPIGNIPLFLAITQQNDFKERKRILRKAALACFLILSFFLLTGNFLLHFFHITIEAFKIAGGIVSPVNFREGLVKDRFQAVLHTDVAVPGQLFQHF